MKTGIRASGESPKIAAKTTFAAAARRPSAGGTRRRLTFAAGIAAACFTAAGSGVILDAADGSRQPTVRVVPIALPAPSTPRPAVATAAASVVAASTPVQVAEVVTATRPDPALSLRVENVEVSPGDSLYAIFKRHGIPQRDLAAVMASGRDARRLSRLKPGDRIELGLDDGDRLTRLVLPIESSRSLEVVRRDRAFVSRFVPHRSEPAPPTPAPASGAVAIRPVATAPVAPATLAEGEPEIAIPEASLESARLEGVDISRGDSLYGVFLARGLDTRELARLLDSGPEAARLKRLRPGQRFEFLLDESDSILRLIYHVTELDRVLFEKTGSGYRSTRVRVPLEARKAARAGVIENSLFLAGQRADLSDRLIMELTEIFAWDVDFALDIRSGDRFTVVYEELTKDGEKVKDGAILAAEFVNRGRVIRAIRYEDPNGHTSYFSPDGTSMRKAFLRTPVKFSRISSRFSHARKHPILHKVRAHRGVDYAAPRGTPVKASGDGRVAYLGRKGGYGKVITLRHGSQYTTLYAHLSRFKRGLRTGASVDQGEVIGYVGSTGYATGPHLHYEFRVRGTHHDPLKVKLPKAAPIAKAYREDFTRHAAELLSHLDAASSTRLAAAD